MRKTRLIAGLALLIASQGCTLTIPQGLLAGNGLTGGKNNPSAAPSAVPGQPGVSEPGQPGVMPGNPGMACTVDAKATLDKYDANQDGSWSYGEFIGWYSGIVAVARGCGADTPPAVEPNIGKLISANGQTAVATDDALVISNNSGLLIANNGGGNASAIARPSNCFIDPRTAFKKIDRDANGQISVDELCTNTLFPPVVPPQPKPLPPLPPQPVDDCKGDFAQADADGDGLVTFPEFLRYRSGDWTVSNGLVTNNGGGLISDAGGGLTSKVRRQVLSAPTLTGKVQLQNNNGLIASNGGSIISNNGGTLVSEGGGGLISNHGGGIIDNSGNRIEVDGNLQAYLPIKLEFGQRDTNQDGAIDAGEWCGIAVAPSPRPYPSPVGSELPLPAGCDIMQADQDNDGYVSWEEFYGWVNRMSVNVSKDLAYAKFHGLDADGDGQLDKSEGCGATNEPPPVDLPPTPAPPLPGTQDPRFCGQQFQSFDQDQDGFVSVDEYASGRWKALRFFKAPTPQEEISVRARYRAEGSQYDADGDGLLSLTEFQLACPTDTAIGVPFTNN